jgi:hypothetical protein
MEQGCVLGHRPRPARRRPPPPGEGAWSGLVTGFYTARYIVDIFVTGFPNEARYSLINVCNEF